MTSTHPVPPKGAELKEPQDLSGVIAGACIVGGFIQAVLIGMKPNPPIHRIGRHGHSNVYR